MCGIPPIGMNSTAAKVTTRANSSRRSVARRLSAISAMVTARLFLRPLLAAMQGGSVAGQLQFLSMPRAAALPPTGSRETFIRARATANGLVPRGNQESRSQAPLAEADWLIRRPAGTPDKSQDPAAYRDRR